MLKDESILGYLRRGSTEKQNDTCISFYSPLCSVELQEVKSIDASIFSSGITTHNGPIRFAEKTSQNIISADLLWEKNTVPTKKTSWKRRIIREVNRANIQMDVLTFSFFFSTSISAHIVGSLIGMWVHLYVAAHGLYSSWWLDVCLMRKWDFFYTENEILLLWSQRPA